jgi:deoxycytidylate deaminase
MSKESESRLSNKDKQYLKLAKNAALSSKERRKHGAVIVKSNRVLSIGVNKFRNHPDIIPEPLIKKVCSVHAEMDALNKIKDAKNATIYVARINRFGNPMLSRPCNNCYYAIREAGIKHIVYTD